MRQPNLPRYVKVVRAKGTYYLYFRRHGQRWPLPDYPTSPEFQQAYLELPGKTDPDPVPRRIVDGSLAALIRNYRSSDGFCLAILAGRHRVDIGHRQASVKSVAIPARGAHRRLVGDRSGDGCAAHVDTDVRRRGALLHISDLALEAIACADLHVIAPILMLRSSEAWLPARRSNQPGRRACRTAVWSPGGCRGTA